MEHRKSSGFSWSFWMLCLMEMWERLAYYGMRVVVPIYIAQADEPGGLHFSQAQKGSIYAWWFVFQSILPTFTGGFADRYGYKRTIFASITLKVIGYVLMATQRDYWGFWVGTMILATGTAIFKPGIQGSLAHTLNRDNASKGWGLFYWLVNVGAMMGPPLAGILRAISWSWVFYGCALIVSLNYLMLFTYKEVDSKYEGEAGFFQVFQVTLKNLFDARLLSFLMILSGFWLMMYQLWDLHPNFVTDWVDSSALAAHVPELWTQVTERGPQVKQENLLNLNAALITLFVIPVSWMVAKMRTLSAMIIGMLMAGAGVLVSGMSMTVWVFLAGVAFFSFGEMLTGPKKNEYLAMIAPPGKKGLYLGYVNVPVGVGAGLGSKIAGWVYGNYGEKAVLAQKYLAEHTDYLQQKGRAVWDGQVASLESTLGVGRQEAYQVLREHLGQNGHDTTQLLWDTYHPYLIWFPFAAIGGISVLLLIVYARAARRWESEGEASA